MAKYIITGGPHYKRAEDGKWKRYVKGDTMDLSDLEAQSIMDKVQRVGPKESAKPVESKDTQDTKVPLPEQSLKMVHKGGGKYDVVNEVSGKTINSVLLTKSEANGLLANS